MSRINSRQKGARGERLWRDILKKEGFEARRGQQFSGSKDSPDVVHNIPDVHFEVKLVEKLNIEAAIKQACEDAPDKLIRAVVHKKNRGGWLCTLPKEDFFALLMGYLTYKGIIKEQIKKEKERKCITG